MTPTRVRIAPSPTGDPHVATAYIGLYNYCHAKANGGQFILRIEDTDQTRSRPEYERRIFEGLRWVGLQWDEGPDVGGPVGPYRQSERTAIYQEHCRQLVEAGHAYPCFCTPEDLERIRREQREAGRQGYDGRCRRLAPDDVKARLDAGQPHVIRLAMPEGGECVIHDLLFGEVRYPYDQMDDQVLLKSDGMPTYHLANVVDDHLMGITTVIRGEEWLPSTPKHIHLYDCFGWAPPQWAHVSLLLNPDRTKMSKRKNPTSIFYYRDAGFLPEALLNYMGLVGYTRPNMTDEMFTLEEMVSDFDITRMSRGGSIFDIAKLRWLNGRYIRERLTPEALLERMKAWRFNDDFLGQTLPLVHERMETLGDFMERCHFFWRREVAVDAESLVPKTREAPEVVDAIQCLLWRLEETNDWTAAGVESAVRAVADFMDWKIRELTAVLYPAITGGPVGPPLFDAIAVLGKDLSRMRLMTALETLGGPPGKKKLANLEKRFQSSLST